MKWNNPPFCELCRKKLIGRAEINSSIEADGTVSVTVKESLVIDWAFCRLCQSIICQEFCLDSRTGLCQPCSHEQQLAASDSELNFFETTAERTQTDDILSAEIIF